MKELVGKGKPFYSAVDKAAALLKRKVGTGAEFMQELKGLGGIKQSEIEDRGLGDIMGAPKMTHEQFMAALAAKPAPAIQEKVFANKLLKNPGSEPDPHHGQYTLPGGENYREMLIKAPAGVDNQEKIMEMEAKARRIPMINSTPEQQAELTNLFGQIKQLKEQEKEQKEKEFKGVYHHFGGEPNILASMRLKDRLGPNGEKLLHLEELQSDWHQQGREKGYKKTPEELQAEKQQKQKAHDEYVKNESNTLNEEYKALKEKMRNSPNIDTATPDQLHQLGLKLLAKTHIANFESPQDVEDIRAMQKQYDQLKEANDLKQRETNILRQLNILSESKPSEPENRGVPNAPFKKNWEEMALKRLIHHAAEKGYHGIVVTPGAEQADRYNLANYVDSINWERNPDGTITFTPEKENANLPSQTVKGENLDQYLGKEVASQILNDKNNNGFMSGLQLRVGGEGMKGFYDKKVPNILNSIGKKYGVKTQLHGHKIETEPKQTFGNDSFSFGSPAKTASVHHFPITEEMRKDVLTNGLPLHKEGGIIHKAVGGQVQPSINAMRAELAKKMPTSLSDLSSIGANEAPSMNVKAYVPPARDGQLPVGGVSMGNQPLPVGGIDMSRQQGQQLMPANLVPQQGAPQGQPQAGGMPSPLSAGASSPQPPSNILQMTPQGQALNAMSPPQPAKMADGGGIPMTYKVGGSDNMLEPQPNWYQDDGEKTFNIDNLQQLAKGGKIEVRPTVFDDAATRRNEKIEAAARALMEGEMKQKAYAKLVAKEKPVKPYDFIPAPATDEQAMNVLIDRQKQNWRSHENWPAGHRVGLRLDIPAYERHGVWVNSIHDESGGEDKFPTSYGPVSSVRNAEFHGSPHKAVRVATGEQNKTPFAKIKGELEHMTEEQAIKHFQKYFKHPDYRQIGYDPRRHGDFYDRETMEPVTHSEHVVQIGPLVLAKKPKYGKRELYAKGGSAKPKKPLHYAPSPAMKKAEIEAHAERMARQMAGLENPTGKTLQQLAREKDLSVGIKKSKKNEQPIIDYQNLKGSYSVGVPGDTSRGGLKPSKTPTMGAPKAGEYLTSIGGEELEQPVGLYGGKDYGAYGHPAGWASDLGASRGMFNVVRRLAKENPESKIFGHYHKMSPEALYHAVHMLDTVLAHHQPHKLPPEQIEFLNNLMRNERLTTNKNDKPYPEFAGFENPADIRLQAPFNSGMRKKIISMLGKEKYVSGGKQKLDDIIYAISHPELRDIETGAGGSSIIQFDPSRSLKESISPHPTYGHDIPSQLVGRTRYLTPADILAPRSMHNARQEIARMGKKVIPFNQAKMNIIREPIDEQYINQMGEYEHAMKKRLGYKKGGKVKLSTNMDTINLELSRRTKKAK